MRSEEGFEYHVILSSSKPCYRVMRSSEGFENPVIFSASQIWNDVGIAFEYHVILSSDKPSKRGGFVINFCSL